MIVDLDELVTKCADPRSRTYIQEAVQCYKAGAHRAAVVACWIAVAFDLIDKIRAIAATGDAEAATQIARFDQIRRNDDLAGSLAFERELPDMALTKFEFISHVEHIDLKRLQEDRNRCAHPSMVSDTDVFQPPAELARLHIVNAMRNILMHPPTQGKAALDRLTQELASNYFPARASDVLTFLRAGPLLRARASLLRNYCVVLMKGITIRGADPATFDLPSKALNAIFAVRDMHPAWWADQAPAIVNAVVSARTTDSDLAKVVENLCSPPGLSLWPLLTDSEQLRIKTFVTNIPSEHLDSLECLDSSASPIHAEVGRRFARTTLAEALDTLWVLGTPQPVIDRMIASYAASGNYAEANRIGKALRVAAADSTQPAADAEAIVRAAMGNSQVRESIELEGVLASFARRGGVGEETIARLRADYGLL